MFAPDRFLPAATCRDRPRRIGLLDRVVHAEGGDGGTPEFGGGQHRPTNQIVGDERPGRVVYDDHLRPFRYARKRPGDRISPLLSPVDEGYRLAAAAQVLRRRKDGSPPAGPRQLSEIRSHDTNASTLRARIGRPPSDRSCFGESPPNRRPRPPAAMIADTNMEESGLRSQSATVTPDHFPCNR